MANRYLVLATLLLWRLVLGGYLSRQCRPGQVIRLSGNINTITQTATNKIGHSGTFYYQIPERSTLKEGSEITITGTCQRSLTDFLLSRTYLDSSQILEIRSPMVKVFDAKQVLTGIRGQLAAVYRRQLSEPEAGLVAGVVLGAKSSLSQTFYEELVDTGTVQIVVASGYNLSLVAIFLASFLWWFFNKKLATIVLLILASLYALLTGGEPPVTRALLMLALVTLAPLASRKLRPDYVFWLALWLILFLDPSMIESISFQLSSAATGGLVFFQEKIAVFLERLKLQRLLGALGADLASTLAAQLTTAPIILYHFGRVSLWAPLANALIAPLIGPLTVLGFLGQVEALVLPYGGIVSLSTFVLARSVTLVIKFFARA